MSRMIAAASPVAAADRPARVLVVDDDPVNLLVMSALLASRGLAPLLAASGAEAVALACERSFDLILMDVQMPGLDGFAATSAIRRFEADRARPAVPVLAHSSLGVHAEALAAHGLNGSLPKPCADVDLDACLLRWCPTHRPAPRERAGAAGHRAWPAAGRAAAVPARTAVRP